MGTPRAWNIGLYFFLCVFFSKIDEKKTEAAVFDIRQPSFITEDGHLLVVSGSDRNITLKTSGRGYVNINGENIVNLVNMARNVSVTLDRKLSKLTDLENTVRRLNRQINGPIGLVARMMYLEAGLSNSSTNGGGNTGSGFRPGGRPSPQDRGLRRRITALEYQVRRLRMLLSANECVSNPCRNGGTCEDHFNGYVCRCPTNWEGSLCETDVNECAHFAGTDLGCQNGATCINKRGTYECECATGWFGVHCTQRSNDCSKASSQELCGNGVCITQSGTTGYACICNQGWTTDGTSKACTKDVDECTSNNPPCSRNPVVECVNVPGSFFCAHCPAGFTGNGYYCTDINECQENNGGCSSLVQCVNTYGSRVCSACPPGYEGNGETCNFQGGACTTNNGGCHRLATCQDNSAISSTYVMCKCPAGYTGTGIGPDGCFASSGGTTVNNCASNPCVMGTCHNLASGFICTCRQGFSGPRCSVSVDPCASNPCQNGGTCVRISGPPLRGGGGGPRMPDRFTCTCASGFGGTTCSSQNQACGGVRAEESGTIKFPTSTGTYQNLLSCAWVITVNTSKVVNATFKTFNLESSTDCLYDWLQIHDGRSAGDQLIGRYCGNTLPQDGNIVSTTESLYLWFRSDRSSNHDGFELSWNSSSPVCGGSIETTTFGRLASPGSPGKYPNNRDCYWTITGPLNKRLQFHFYTLMIAPSYNCSQDWLQIHDGITPSDVVVVKYCNSSHPPPLTIPSHAALVHFHSDAVGSDTGFQLTYSVIEGFPGCGGVMTSPTGDIVSPRDLDKATGYKKSVDCEWRIQLGLKERIILSFELFDIERSASCNFDYLEIREGADNKAPLVGRYCGSTIPSTYTSLSNILHIRFRTDFSLSGEGFHIKYKTMCGETYETSEGIIQSPMYPNPYPNSRTCEYVIKQPMGKAIKLHFLDFDVEDTSYPNCLFDNVQIRDGDNENSTLVGTYCGENESLIPPDVISTFNYLWIQFNTDASDRNKGFQANYSTVDVGCGGILKEPLGVIESPSDSESYPHDIVCNWVIVAKPGYVVRLQFISISLEFHPQCKRDYVEVFDNSSTPDAGGSMGRFCSGTPPTLMSSDRTMTVRFVTDSSVARDGFSASYFTIDATKMCGGNFYTTTGRITSPNHPGDYPHDKDCSWTITVPQGQQIMLAVKAFDMEQHTECRFDFLEIRNGGHDSSPLVGRFCGTDIPPLIPSLSNQMYLRFKTDGSRSAAGFKLTWDATATGCGGTLTAPTGSIMSPNYPQPYGRNAECFWRIVVNQGSKIQVVFNDIDLEAHTTCRMDYVEFYEGMDTTGPVIGRYCTSHPPMIVSKNNYLYIRFRSDVSQEGRGFHIKYDAVCTTTLTGYRGVIESPNFPRPYPSGRDCTWTIAAPKGNKVNLTFSHFDMENASSSIETEDSTRAAQPCRFDYVEITEGKEQEAANTVLGRFCGTALPPPLSSTKDHVYIHFVSDDSVADNGFRIEWILNGCGGRMTHPQGEFMSPGYPGAYPESVECEWLIVLEADQSVQLNISDLALERSRGECGYDGLKVYGGPDDTSPLLGTFCHPQKNTSLTASGNFMLLKFYSDFSYSGRGFKAKYAGVPSRCGGRFTAPSGSIHSRNYPQNYDPNDDCQWLIEVDPTHVVRLTFTSFDVEAHHNCSMDYVRVYDGDSLTSPKLLEHCGNVLPTPREVTSKSNKLLVRFKTDGSVAAKGFLANYSIACGARIVTEDSGILRSRDSISVYSNLEYSPNCSWIIVGSKPEDRVTLTTTHLDVSPVDMDDGDCEYYRIDVRDGEDQNSPMIGTFCGNRAPPPMTSRGNAMSVHLVTMYGGHYGEFVATYSVLSGACGGELTSEHGSFISPNYPDNYPPNSECIWTIHASPGNRAMISFASFDLEASDFCDGDYVEIREESAIGPMIGTYCTSIPSNVTAANRLWIKFKSNGGGNAKGFRADYSLLHGNELTGVRGQIASPLYPKVYIQSADFNWRITVQFGYAISITFQNFFMDKVGTSCNYFLAVYDGYDDTAPELLKACGINIVPEPITSTSNVVYLRLLTDPVKEGTRFLLDWLQVAKNQPNVEEKVNASGCDAVIDLKNRNMTTPYVLRSPGYPDGYGPRLNCNWIFETKPGSSVALMFRTMDLEQSTICNMDYVSVFQGENNQPLWKPVQKFCLPNATSERPVMGSSLMKVVFHTDALKNESGFEAVVYTACGGMISDSSGAIEVTNETVLYRGALLDCRWNITVRTGRKIAVTFTRFELSRTTEVGCGSNIFVMLKNGHGDDSPILGNGKYCGRNLPEVPQTTGNKLFVKFQAYVGNQGFRMVFQEVSHNCGGNIKLTKTSSQPPSVNISSPNFPNIPPPHIECFWVIMAPSGERLHIDFGDRFDLTPSTGCKQAAVELRDGGTQYSQPLGPPYCLDTPSSKYTTGNILYVRYFTDVNDPKDGFMANITLASCGGTIRAARGVVTFPKEPGTYPQNLDCQWRIVGPKGTYLTLDLQRMDFYTVGTNCTHGDYLTIDEIIPGNETGVFRNNVGLFCRKGLTEGKLRISSNEALISFHSVVRQASTKVSSLTGFKLFFNASKEVCAQILNTPSGTFQSPGYGSSGGITNRFCRWEITVPVGRRITLTLLDFDLEPMSAAYGQRISFFNQLSYKSRITMYNSTSVVRPVKSSGNQMLVHFWAKRNTGHRGFKASYTSDEPSICRGDFNQSSGIILSPVTSNDSFSFYCDWDHTRSAALNQTLAVTLINGTIGNRDTQCQYSQSVISITSQGEKLRLGDLCGNFTTPFIIRSPFPSTKLEAISGFWHGPVTFALSYKTSPCGGQLSGPEDTVTSPGFPSNYPADTDCAWSVEYPPEQVIKINFTNFELDGSCNTDYVIIYNGPSPKSPRIGQYCGTNKPSIILAQSNKIWIDFHSDSSGQKQGFNLTLEPVAFGCGGIFHAKAGEMTSPEYPAQYPANSECEWEIRVEEGYTIQLKFVDRFFLETSSNCEKDYVEVYDFTPDGTWKKIGRYCGRNAPEVQNSTESQMKVLFRSNGDTPGDGFKARWTVTCGGIISGKSEGRIVSPGYPDAYASNLKCNYTILAPGQHIMTKFTTFNIEAGYSTDCRYDNVTFYGLLHYWSREPQVLGTYCGVNAPPNRVFKDKVSLDFRTDSYVTRKGFVMEYSVSSCGGNMTSPGTIETSKTSTSVMGAVNCTWIITAPANNVVVVRFSKIELEYTYRCNYEAVSVYEGAFINDSAIVAQFCGNLSDSAPVLKSTTNTVVVMLRLAHQREDFSVRAEVIFTKGEKAGCGGKLSVGPSATTLRSPGVGSDGNYEPFLDCHWLLTAPDSHTINLQLTRLSVAPCFNRTFNASAGCTCDYLEIRDGTNQFADLIGRYCGDQPTAPIVSSLNKMWVRFASDGVNEAPGFTATVTSTPSVCGQLVLNVTNDTQILTSPNWPSNYPPNLRCRWLLSGSKNARIEAHFEEIKLDDADGCPDSVTFTDIGTPMVIDEGTGADEVTFTGQQNRPISLHRGSRSPTSAIHFCGTPKQMDFYSESSNVAVTFVSNHERAAKGFKMRYAVAGCTRNYTAVQGRILVDRVPEHCYMVITAAVNHTISLYFMSFQFFSSRDCGDKAMEVRDGANGDAPLLNKFCGYELPNPIFSTGNKLYLHTWRPQQPVSNEHFDITYTTTDKGRGCGGQVFNYGGTISSPFYPNNVRNASVCRWDISVPYGRTPLLRFHVFDLGPKSTCDTDFVEVIDVDATGNENVRSRFCGGDNPSAIASEANTVAIRYTRSVHNGGTGWQLRFMAHVPGSAIPPY